MLDIARATAGDEFTASPLQKCF